MTESALREWWGPSVGPARSDTFDRLHARYFYDVRSFVRRRVSDREVADDITQETFLRALRSWHTYDPARPAWPWLATIARNLICNRLRDERRRLRHIDRNVDVSELEQLPDERSALEDTYSEGEHGAAIRRALASLPERHRRVLLMRAVADLSCQEIAEHEGITVDASKSLLKRARKAFRDAYGAAVGERGLGAFIAPMLAVRCRRALDALAVTPFVEAGSQAAVALAATTAILLASGAPNESRSMSPRPATVDAVSVVATPPVARADARAVARSTPPSAADASGSPPLQQGGAIGVELPPPIEPLGPAGAQIRLDLPSLAPPDGLLGCGDPPAVTLGP